MLRSTGDRGLQAGPVPWIHWRRRSAGISEPMKSPRRASPTRMGVRGMQSSSSRKAMRSRYRARAARRSMRSAMTAFCSWLKGASASRAARAAGVYTSE